jgi:hypothetical protein
MVRMWAATSRRCGTATAPTCQHHSKPPTMRVGRYPLGRNIAPPAASADVQLSRRRSRPDDDTATRLSTAAKGVSAAEEEVEAEGRAGPPCQPSVLLSSPDVLLRLHCGCLSSEVFGQSSCSSSRTTARSVKRYIA